MIVRTTNGVKEALVLIPVIRELRMRRPDLRICVETERPELFEGNILIDAVGEWVVFHEDETYINLDAMSAKGHIMDVTSRAVLGDTRIMNRHIEVHLTDEEIDRGKTVVSGMSNVVAVCLNEGIDPEMQDNLIDEIGEWGYEAVFLDELKLPLRDSLAVIHQCELYVGMDNDISYMAMCSDVPMVMYYTSGDPLLSVPFRRGVPFISLSGDIPMSQVTDAVAEVTMG